VAAFFAEPHLPDARAYRQFRQFLLETSQVPGGFYTKDMRAMARRCVVDLMQSDRDPYGFDRSYPATSVNNQTTQPMVNLTMDRDIASILQ